MKGAGYILVHTPDMITHYGTTQTSERIVNPESEYLKNIEANLRPYERVRAYYPNQTYIGNVTPMELKEVEGPWQDLECPVDERYGKYGEIMPQDEFYLLIQAVDEFELVFLEKGFVEKTKPKLAEDPIITPYILDRIKDGVESERIDDMVVSGDAEGLYMGDKLVGAVKKAHAFDPNLSAHVMVENLVSKASASLAMMYAVKNAGIDRDEVEYTIECSEEACGDMNQRGGGNFAKGVAEIAELSRSTGSDVRGFCAAPAHAVLVAAGLVKSGIFKTVAVGQAVRLPLGMNGKDHVKRSPIPEDVLRGFAVIISENDGINP